MKEHYRIKKSDDGKTISVTDVAREEEEKAEEVKQSGDRAVRFFSAILWNYSYVTAFLCGLALASHRDTTMIGKVIGALACAAVIASFWKWKQYVKHVGLGLLIFLIVISNYVNK